MARRYVALIIFIGIILSGCKTNCNRSCGFGLALAGVNYTFAELDTVIVKSYTPNDSFNHLVDSTILTSTDTGYTSYNPPVPVLIPTWAYPAVGGTSTTDDTLYNDNMPSYDYIGPNDYTGVNLDIEIIVPSNNYKTYRYSNIYFVNLSQNQPCDQPVPNGNGAYCAAYLAYYELNGALVKFPANTNSGYLYFSK